MSTKKGNRHTALERAGHWVEALTYEDLPLSVISLAKSQILDTIAAICAGSRSRVGLEVRRAIEMVVEPGSCTVFPNGQKWPLFETVYYHSVMSNALEMDSLVFIGHVAQSAVSIPLALAELKGLDSRSVLVAQVAAVEVAGRLGAYLASGPHHGHMRAYLHRVAGAVAASKLLNMDSKRIQNSIAIALSMSEYVLYPAAFSPDTKVLCTGAPSVEGLRAAFLSKEGVDATTDVLEHPAGFFSVFSYVRDIPGIWDQLGKTWSLHAFSSKHYAACAYAQGPVEAALAIRREDGFDSRNIVEVTIHAPITTASMEPLSRPHNPNALSEVNLNFSTRKSVAATLLYGELTGEVFTPDVFEKRKESIWNLSERITLSHDWQMSIDLARGVDAAIKNPGKPGVLGMSQTNKSVSNLKRTMGGRSLLSLRDLPHIWRMDRSDQRYLIRRYWRGYRSRFPFLGQEKARTYRSFETDLTKYALRQAGRVRVRMNDGQIFERECRLPRGFSGDPNREEAVVQKYERESIPIWGMDRSHLIKRVILGLPETGVADITKLVAAGTQVQLPE